MSQEKVGYDDYKASEPVTEAEIKMRPVGDPLMMGLHRAIAARNALTDGEEKEAVALIKDCVEQLKTARREVAKLAGTAE